MFTYSWGVLNAWAAGSSAVPEGVLVWGYGGVVAVLLFAALVVSFGMLVAARERRPAVKEDRLRLVASRRAHGPMQTAA